MFIQGRANIVLRSEEAKLGTSFHAAVLPNPTAQGVCGLNYHFDLYTPSYTDHNLSRLPDGRLLDVQLFRKHGVTPDVEYCLGDLPEVQRAVVVRVSGDCGRTWSVRNVIDAKSIRRLGYTFIDRQNLFVDTEQHMMYLSFRLSANLDGSGDNRLIVMGARTDFGFRPAWRTVAAYRSPASMSVLTADPHDGGPSTWLLGCVPALREPELVWFPDLPAPHDPGAAGVPVYIEGAPDCRIVLHALTAANIANRLPQLSIAPVPGTNRLRLVYPDVVTRGDFQYQIAHVVDVHLTYSSFPEGVHAYTDRVEDIDVSAQGRNVLWPDLVWPEGFETRLADRGEQVMTWVEIPRDSLVPPFELQRVRVRMWLPGVWWDFGYVRSSIIDPSKLHTTAKGDNFFGDYRYGTFIGDSNGTASYFAPWAETRRSVPNENAEIHGALVKR